MVEGLLTTFLIFRPAIALSLFMSVYFLLEVEREFLSLVEMMVLQDTHAFLDGSVH